MIECRLCHASAAHTFDRLVLSKYTVGYYKCFGCGSLQTETPYWLTEAYDGGNLTASDAGPCVRSLNSLALIYVSAKILGFPANAKVLDFGGGSGLLTRLLRDQGFDARWYDAYARNDLAQGYDDDGSIPDIICSFEVAEHLAEPATELAPLFQRGAALLIIGTETFRDQGPEWWYISPQSGQHIFFYTQAGMAALANRFGYTYERLSSTHIFTRRPIGKGRGRMLWRALTPFSMRLIRAWLGFRLTNDFAARDMNAVLSKV